MLAHRDRAYYLYEETGTFIMKEAEKQVWHQFNGQARRQIYIQIKSQVRFQVEKQVWDKVLKDLKTVNEQTWSQVKEDLL